MRLPRPEAAYEDIGMPVTVREGTAADAAALAELRWRWAVEERDYAGTERAAFVELFSAWAIEHLSTHLAFLAEVGDRAVGMAWLMVADRVPSPARRDRRFGDVQSVYVVPELRDSGVGAVLLNAVLAGARSLDLEHVTVHSSDRAVPFYQRVGFRHGRRWLRWKPE
jgi:GNAT superfamily N-acetyltransferase